MRATAGRKAAAPAVARKAEGPLAGLGPAAVNPVWTALATSTGTLVQRTCAACAGGGTTRPQCEEERHTVQAELEVGAPNDRHEIEADRVADQVMRTAGPGARPAEIAPARLGGGREAAPDGLLSGLGAGRPLDPATRGYMEPRFGRSFAGVRIHSDGEAAASARSINAHAFTFGSDIVFGEGRYSPQSGSGMRLLAHELTHVVQQGAGGPALVQREVCPTRPAGEAVQSTAAGGVLATDVIFTSATRQLVIQDFGVNRTALPPGATTDPAFERFMSLAVGDPTTALAVKGYTDCVGSAPENLALRDQRADAVIAAFPAALRTHARFSFPTSPTTDFRDSNTTAEGRARNRAVVVTFAPVPAVPGQDSCDVPTRAGSLDEYMFLVRCAEGRLGLTAAADAPTVVSVLRQLYFGSGSWSASQNSVWNSVITGRPWSPGTSPETRLGSHLFNALRSSQVVGGRDVGHLLTGLDAMLNPGEVVLSMGPVTMGTGLANEEWATWAGDAGSAAAEFAVDTYANTLHGSMADYFNTRYADPDDLLGNIDSFALRAGLTGLAPAAQLQHSVTLSAPFSEILMQYFRISSSTLSGARTSGVRNFVQAYGGVLSGSTLTNRPVLEAALFPPIENFAGRFAIFRMLQRGFLNTPPPTPGPLVNVTLPTAVADATRLYVDFLLPRL